MTYAFEAEGLVKRFGKTVALDGVDLAAEAGTVLGVLGHNGAGKTTAVRILATLLRADAGTARVNGFDVVKSANEVRRRIGLTGQYASVDENLTGFENLTLIGQLLDLHSRMAKVRATELLAQFDLTEAGSRLVKTYSGGMRRRLDIAASLVARPAVIFLDEPTTGLDPAKREDVWVMIRGLIADGVTVLLTTQYLDEADALADDIVVFDQGKIIATGTPNELKQVVGARTLEVRPVDQARLPEVALMLAELTGHATESPSRGLLSAPADSDAALTALVRRLDDAGIAVTELALRLPSLDEAFFALTGRHDHVPADDDNPKNEVAA